MAMVVQEALDGLEADVRILATDISTRVLTIGLEGKYPIAALDGVSPSMRERYFASSSGARGLTYEVSPEIRRMVVFRRLNLAVAPYPMSGPLDFVLCRNVMIYFDQRVRQTLLGEIERLLRPGGVLAVGHSETTSGTKLHLTQCDSSVYRKPLDQLPELRPSRTPAVAAQTAIVGSAG